MNELNLTEVAAFITAARQTGWKTGTTKLRDQLWHTERFLGLRCDLSGEIVAPPAAKVAITMRARPAESLGLGLFEEEAPRVHGNDALQVLIRRRFCEHGLPGLHMAFLPDGRPAYAQWLLDAAHANRSGHYMPLGETDCLLEGAYTFTAARGMGMMADGMVQLLRIARAKGFATCFTYVAEANVPSLKGCARAGFVLDHLRLNDRRLWRRGSMQVEPDAQAAEAWRAAGGGRTGLAQRLPANR